VQLHTWRSPCAPVDNRKRPGGSSQRRVVEVVERVGEAVGDFPFEVPRTAAKLLEPGKGIKPTWGGFAPTSNHLTTYGSIQLVTHPMAFDLILFWPSVWLDPRESGLISLLSERRARLFPHILSLLFLGKGKGVTQAVISKGVLVSLGSSIRSSPFSPILHLQLTGPFTSNFL
jgi:hypothetical protein